MTAFSSCSCVYGRLHPVDLGRGEEPRHVRVETKDAEPFGVS